MDCVSLGRFVIEDYIPNAQDEDKNLTLLPGLKPQALTESQRAFSASPTEHPTEKKLKDAMQGTPLEPVFSKASEDTILRVIQDDGKLKEWEDLRALETHVENLAKSQLLAQSVMVEPASPTAQPAHPLPELRKMQISFLKKVGTALYTDVFPCTVEWLTYQVATLLQDKDTVNYLIDRLTDKKTAPSQTTPIRKPQVKKTVWDLGVADQTLAGLEGLGRTFQRIATSENLRTELKTELEGWLGKKHKGLISAAALYGPDTAHSFISTLTEILKQPTNNDILIAFSDSLRDFLTEKNHEQIDRLMQLTLQKALPAPFIAAARTFFTRLFNLSLSTPLFEEMEPQLVGPFFPTKTNFSKLKLTILVRFIEGFGSFFETLNGFIVKIPSNYKKEEERVSFVINSFSQSINGSFLENETGTNGSELCIRRLLGAVFHKYVEDEQFKKGLLLALPLIVRLMTTVLDVQTLDLLLKTFLENPTTLYNPFESEPEPLTNFDCSDRKFNEDFTKAAAKLKQQILLFCEINVFFKAILEPILDFFFPMEGETVQRALNRLSHSGTRFLPVIAMTKLSWVIPVPTLPKNTTKETFDLHCRICFDIGLDESPQHKRMKLIDFEKLINQSAEEKQVLHETTRKMILGTEKETMLLRSRLNSVIPITSAPLETIQKFYRFAEHPQFSTVLIITLLRHLLKDDPSPQTSEKPKTK